MLQPMKAQPTILVAMRLADMRVVHPAQDNTRSCDQCRQVVGIYPSGQKALKRWPAMKIRCARCVKPTHFDIGVPAADTLAEYRAEKLTSKPRPQ
jgi:hypothetical protein